MSRAFLYLRTVARLKPTQVVSRLTRKKVLPRRIKTPRCIHDMHISVPELDCDSLYTARFDADGLESADFLLINERHSVDLYKWRCSDASHLWNFNLHYFEYCVSLAARYRREGDKKDIALFKKLVSSWMDACPYSEGDGWHPYTISLRLVNWLICLDFFGDTLAADSSFMTRLHDSMYMQYRHLLMNQETHLLANHYFENLKTLCIMSLYFGEDDVHGQIEKKLASELHAQILDDGVHYERSMMYHKILIEDMLRVLLAYRSCGKAAPSLFAEKTKLMLDAMASIEKGMGKTPFFNDSADGVAKGCRELSLSFERLFGWFPDCSKVCFPDSGFYKFYDGDIAVLFFAGEPGPRFMLGHAHCDLLSFELSVKGKPVVVNSGTYAYQSAFRPFFRSTAAHNTATIDGCDQMECWSEHRVARGIRNIFVSSRDDFGICASFENYKGLRHERVIHLRQGFLDIRDSASGMISASLILAPDAVVFKAGDRYCARIGEDALSFESDVSPSLEEVCYSPEFGVLRKTRKLVFENEGFIRVQVLVNGYQKENEE